MHSAALDRAVAERGAAWPERTAETTGGASDQHRAALELAFRPSGGLASGDHVAALVRPHCDQPISQLARWIVERHVVSFVWRSQRLIPLFQFDQKKGAVRRGVREAVAELSAAFDDLETASWFARPNGWLAGAAPADVFARNTAAVLDAARADRFVAIG